MLYDTLLRNAACCVQQVPMAAFAADPATMQMFGGMVIGLISTIVGFAVGFATGFGAQVANVG